MTVPTMTVGARAGAPAQAAAFWGIADPKLAVLVNSIVGGTPAYARELTLGDAPDGEEDFGPWVHRNVLNPARPLFREARFLLAEEPDLRDTALLRARADIDENTRLLCFSGAGFTDELRTLAETSNAVQLVDLDRLYHGA